MSQEANVEFLLRDYLADLEKECQIGIRKRSGIGAIENSLTIMVRSGALTGDPEQLCAFLRQKQYAKSTFQRNFRLAASFWNWVLPEGGVNPYYVFLLQHKNKSIFRQDNEPKRLKITFNKAESLLRKSKIPKMHKDKALQLLYSGMRWSESFTFDGSECMGKGEKRRDIIPIKKLPSPPASVDYESFRWYLKKATGLSPHDLRRLYATKSVDMGVDPFELRKRLGHASILTTQRYVA